ncbi:acetyltransferase domain-containing protein [Babesia ovata]|uniref:Acetyltransferase domain-containing protein n=1 Tax=Babesia ovata TaxID=189622 RepID=A0A2H6KB32_9APIC|nr:acetyltransferase domain-containing protein [Babesia ovata]GBE60202.1 acetyltransferase domain-containing protein [Babesia ovata]
MDPSVDIRDLFENKLSFSEEFEVGDLRFIFKPLESYEEYLEVRPLVETLSNSPILHCRKYVDAMLRLPSYYPFLVCLIDDSSDRECGSDTAANPSCNGEVDGDAIGNGDGNGDGNDVGDGDADGDGVGNGGGEVVGEGVSDSNGYSDSEVSSPETNRRSATLHIVGYIEVYMMPHLGRLFDSRFERIIIDPKYRNKGVCQKMVAIAIDFCSSIMGCNRIDMICSNPIAIHVYEKFGFELVKTNTYRKTLS